MCEWLELWMISFIVDDYIMIRFIVNDLENNIINNKQSI